MAYGVAERSGPSLFNSLLETGMRSLVILDAAYPRAFDLSEMTWLDDLVVHTADIGGPTSLHPDVPHRSGELLVRRPLVEQGLTLMRRQHLVVRKSSPRGVLYRASDEGTAIVDHMRTNYAQVLRARARWLAERVEPLVAQELKRLVDDRFGRWSIEFDAPQRRIRL
jgi:hypothetical protein